MHTDTDLRDAGGQVTNNVYLLLNNTFVNVDIYWVTQRVFSGRGTVQEEQLVFIVVVLAVLCRCGSRTDVPSSARWSG